MIAGVDEVGRGPLAGPVVAAAVILDPTKPIQGLRDSKKLSEKKREALALEIKEKALAFSIARASVAEIDQYNILRASLLAMQRAILTLSLVPQQVLVDGIYIPEIPYAAEAIIGGDALVDCISAASIIAKVARDNEMILLDREYPGYGFAQHKGYPTVTHRAALMRLGPSAIHRLSFAPVKESMKSSFLAGCLE